MAAAQVAERASEMLAASSAGAAGGGSDLAMLFIAGEHVAAAPLIAREVRERLGAAALVGVSTQTVIGGAVELEGAPGVSLLAARLPGATIRAFSTADLVGPDMGDGRSPERLGARLGLGADLRAIVLFTDPFSLPLVKVLPELNAARPMVGGAPTGLIVGGLASGGRAAGDTRLVVGDEVLTSGAVGVSISGAVRVDAVVSQGARPIGETLVVTGARGNAIMQLGGHPALRVLEGLFESLDERDQALVREQGVLIGVVANEYKERFGRADFLIRNVVGADRESGALAVADRIRVGQTVRFHVRDRRTADEDLSMLLDAQALHGPPAGALLITCNQRGRALFGEASHDARALARAFGPDMPGEQRAKGGVPMGDGAQGATIPVAGFMASGEIGPAGGSSALHGQTACAVLFRGR
jgi:small ligand-binding sensory domain FIST